MVLHGHPIARTFPVRGSISLHYVASLDTRCHASPASKAKLSRFRCQCQGSPGTEQPGEDEVNVKGDWREFRASLVSTEQGGDVWSARWCQENLHLLQQQVF